MGYTNIEVFSNDKIALSDIDKYDKILLSPGPGIPSESGILLDLIKQYAPTKSIMGVCLGLQAIGEAFGGKLINLPEVFHGVAMDAEIIEDDVLFKNLPKTIKVGRYHSWAVSNEDFPSCVKITSVDSEGTIMALDHKDYDVRAVQFHPESILSSNGSRILSNFLKQTVEFKEKKSC